MIQLNHKSFGQGDAIVILHGLFGTLDNWQTLAKKLAEDYYVFLVDQRNHGRSPHVEGMSYPLMANDLKEFLEQNWIHQAHIIGHSMGGKTAMQFALDYPDLVNKLVVVDIAPKTYLGGHELILSALRNFPVNSVESRKEAEQTLLEAGIEELGIRQFLLKNLTRSKAGGYEWKMNFPEIDKHYQNILANIEAENKSPFDGKTLFIRGANSNYIQDADADLIETLFPQSTLETVPQAGHWVHAEQPQALLELLRNFLD
ncbi:MAG: alpha/beta fold hydrolase [Bacteroidota bacterium]